jgi:hypothetical protein
MRVGYRADVIHVEVMRRPRVVYFVGAETMWIEEMLRTELSVWLKLGRTVRRRV